MRNERLIQTVKSDIENLVAGQALARTQEDFELMKFLSAKEAEGRKELAELTK